MSIRNEFHCPQSRAVLILAAMLFCQFRVAIADDPLQHGIVVIANRTDQVVEVQEADGNENTTTSSIVPGGVLPLATAGTAAVRIGLLPKRLHVLLDPDTAHEFIRTEDGEYQLRQIGFAPNATPDKSAVPEIRPSNANGCLREMSVLTIPVRILVDEEEPLVQNRWEPRLRERLQAASEILEQHCGVRFEVVEAGVWQSDNSLSDFSELLRELETEVAVPPARLVIGFSSQKRIGTDKRMMGATRVPLHRCILIREWSKAMSDRERIELLVHELGHFLGATHSPEMTSVMRAQLVDGKSNVDRFLIRFDPVNTLIMNLVVEEMRQRPISGLAELSTKSRQQLGNIYTEISRALPDDPEVALARQWIASLAVGEPSSPLARGVRDVLVSIIQNIDVAKTGRSPDEFTNACVRQAALAASELPEDVSRHAFILSFGLILDDSGILRRHPQLDNALKVIESDTGTGDLLQKTAARLTMQSRHDLAQHFWVSAALADLAGEQLALAAGVTKELQDANGGSGFSFADLAADIAGVELTMHVLSSRIRLEHLSKDFTTDDFLIKPTGLPEGLSSAEFLRKYGTVSGAVYRDEESRLRTRILSLPGFHTDAK